MIHTMMQVFRVVFQSRGITQYLKCILLEIHMIASNLHFPKEKNNRVKK